MNTFVLLFLPLIIPTTTATPDDYVDFSDMGNYDHGVQQNVRKTMSQYEHGMSGDNNMPSSELARSHPSSCQESQRSSPESSCVRSIEYLQRIVKSLLRQMNVHTHEFGPGDAITIDLQAELKYDDYALLSKFMNAKQGSNNDHFLDKVDSITSNFIHVVDHSSSSFSERIFNVPALYNLKFWVILGTSLVIVSLMMLMLVKAFKTPAVHLQLLYGFLAIFVVSCVWSFSSLYEDKKAEMMAHMEQHSNVLPKDCDYQNWTAMDSVWYWIRVQFLQYKDRCSEYYTMAMGDPFWKVNPMEAISSSVAFFFFHPLGYIGGKLGAFYLGFISDAPWIYKPILLAVALLLTFLVFYGPFRISSPLLTIEPAWRPVSNNMPTLDTSQGRCVCVIGDEGCARRVVMERPEGRVVVIRTRDTSTDMNDFLEYLARGVEKSEELEIKPTTSIDYAPESGKSSDLSVTKIEVPPLKIEKIEIYEAKQEKLESPCPPPEGADEAGTTGDIPIKEEPFELTDEDDEHDGIEILEKSEVLSLTFGES